jgi:hypothetical protein
MKMCERDRTLMNTVVTSCNDISEVQLLSAFAIVCAMPVVFETILTNYYGNAKREQVYF